MRLRTGLYRGDLAQVVKIYDSKNQVDLRLVPRLDMTNKGEKGVREKRKRNWRPPPRLFDPAPFELVCCCYFWQFVRGGFFLSPATYHGNQQSPFFFFFFCYLLMLMIPRCC